MLNEFLSWWAQQLLAFVPARRDAARADGTVLALTPGLDAVELVLRGQDAPLGRFPLTQPGLAALRTAARTLPAGLRLPPGMLLEQDVVLPLAAERDAGRVLGYEMDRLTPFRADQVFWAWRLLRRDRGRQQLHLRLLLVPRAPLLPVLQALAASGIRPAVLRSGDAVLPLDLAPTRARRLVPALAVACTLLAIGAIVAPFVQQSREAHRVERQIAALRPAVDQAEALRRRAAAAAAGTDALAAQRAQSGDALESLAVLTNLLPDDTVLTDLALRQRVATVSGQSAAAARLIPALAADPAIRNPAFTAPITRNDTTRTEGFSLRAEMAP